MSSVISRFKLRVLAPILRFLRSVYYQIRCVLAGYRRSVQTRFGRITYACPNFGAFRRIVTIRTKEPETIDWLDSIPDGGVLWDIGASTGVYAIYAAANPKVRVYAFEPSPASFATLCKSSELNGMGERVSAFCMAMSGGKSIDYLNMRASRASRSGSTFGDPSGMTSDGKAAVYRHATIGYSPDAFIQDFGAAAPTHLKIDVDGIDHIILENAESLLKNPKLQSVLIEVGGPEAYKRVTDVTERHGFTEMPRPKSRGNRIFRRT